MHALASAWSPAVLFVHNNLKHATLMLLIILVVHAHPRQGMLDIIVRLGERPWEIPWDSARSRGNPMGITVPIFRENLHGNPRGTLCISQTLSSYDAQHLKYRSGSVSGGGAAYGSTVGRWAPTRTPLDAHTVK